MGGWGASSSHKTGGGEKKVEGEAGDGAWGRTGGICRGGGENEVLYVFSCKETKQIFSKMIDR